MSSPLPIANILKTRLRIVSYNVLSETLCNERSYPFNDKEAIREDYRLPLIKSKIQAEITKNGIICLQEVTQKFSGDLHKVFNNNGYYMINGLYGRDFNGNMGVALAFSTKKYDLIESAIITVGSTKKLPREPELSWLWKIINRASSWFIRTETPLWKQVVTKSNMLIAVRLKDKETNEVFVVATYHMPCSFHIPKLMVAHTALSCQAVEKFAKDVPYIYCGDYNFMPTSSQYELVTNGTLPADHVDQPPPIEGDKWTVSLARPMKSAYKEANKTEPRYTNLAKGGRDATAPAFCGCLDYIFVSDHFQVDSVDQLVNVPVEEYDSNIQPTKKEPSDHLLIAADISLGGAGGVGGGGK